MYKIIYIYFVHSPKLGFYIVNFVLLFLSKCQKNPTFGYYNFAHSDVRAKSCKDIYEL